MFTCPNVDIAGLNLAPSLGYAVSSPEAQTATTSSGAGILAGLMRPAVLRARGVASHAGLSGRAPATGGGNQPAGGSALVGSLLQRQTGSPLNYGSSEPKSTAVRQKPACRSGGLAVPCYDEMSR